MIGKQVEFTDGNGDKKEGFIQDKVKVLIVSANANYDNYIISEENEVVHCVNPLNVKRILKLEKPDPKKSH